MVYVCPSDMLSLKPIPSQWGSGLDFLLDSSINWYCSAEKTAECTYSYVRIVVLVEVVTFWVRLLDEWYEGDFSMSPYLVAFVIPSKMTSCMVPCFKIPPHTRTLGGCLCLYFNFLSVFSKALLPVVFKLHSWFIYKDQIIKSFLLLHSFVAPVQSLRLVFIPNRLAVLTRSLCSLATVLIPT